MIIDDHIDLTRHELRNAVLQVLAADPATPSLGLLYTKSTTNRPFFYDGASFKAVLLAGDVTSSLGDVTQGSASGSAGRLKVSAAADKSIQDYSGGAGLIKSDALGVVSPATAGTDYLTGSSTNALTNKTLDATGTGNTVSNLGTVNFAAASINSSTLLASASNTQFPTALAVKTYADNLLGANDAMVFKGVVDASANPNYPAANAGETYKISIAGLIGGASGVAVQVGDMIICSVDGSASNTQALIGANWFIVQNNLDQATTAIIGYTRYATPAETIAKTLNAAAVTPLDLASFTQKFSATFGDAASLTFTLTHNLNSLDVVVQVRDATTNEVRYPKVVNATVNTVTISGYLVAPAAASMRAVIVG